MFLSLDRCSWVGAKLGFMTCAHLHYLINFFNIEIQIFGLITPEKIHVCSLPHLLWAILSFSLIYKTWSYLLCFVRHDASIVDRMISISICIIFRVLYSLKTKACIRIQSLLVVTSPCLLLCITVSTTTKKAAPSLLFIWLSCWVCFFLMTSVNNETERKGAYSPREARNRYNRPSPFLPWSGKSMLTRAWPWAYNAYK